MKIMIPMLHTVKTMVTAFPNGEQIEKRTKYSNSSSFYDTYINSVRKSIYFPTLLFLKQHRFCTCKKTEDSTISQSEDSLNVIFIEGIYLQLNIIVPSIHLRGSLSQARREKLNDYLWVSF